MATTAKPKPEAEEAPKKHFIKHPGGVILHLKGGASEYYGYGQEVDPDDLTEKQLARLHHYTDQKERSEYSVESRVDHEAHRNAVLADAGQANSTSDPVPGNYDQLAEDEATQLVLALQNTPGLQARVLLREMVGSGRQIVLDAGTDEARNLADLLLKDAKDGANTTFLNGVADNERAIEREVQRSAARGRGRGRSVAPAADATGDGSGGDGTAPPPPNE